MAKTHWAIPITFVFILMGVLFSLQFQAQNQISSELSMQRTENLIAMVRDLSEKRQKLAVEIVDLNGKLRAQTQSDQSERELYENLVQELVKIQTVTGDIALQGSGLEILIDRQMPVLYVDIIHIINELWAAGAEAIAINDMRITQNISVFYTETNQRMFITVDNKSLEYPIIIKAIGDNNNLEKGLTIPGGIMDNLALYRAYPILTKADDLTIPAKSRKSMFFFLNEYKPEEKPAATEKPAQQT
ncbi:MAG: DUF881 domain-containing protein [Clostridia bacterium]|jgi:uncharacterized protein YlxW (UPF0749 family)|nr:DUF881 domain-containing protein [Clostridia bacterium]